MSARNATLVPYLSKGLMQIENPAASMFDTNEHAEAQWQRPSITSGVDDPVNSRNTVLAAYADPVCPIAGGCIKS
jgi:hypothetical protein